MTHARYSGERRRSRRVPALGSARFQLSRLTGGYGELIDADLGGICLETATILQAGQRLMMELIGSDGSTIAELKGVVAWTAPCEPTGVRVGVRVYGHDWDSQQALSALVSQGIARRDVIRWFMVRLPGQLGLRQADEMYGAERSRSLVSGL